MNRTWMLLFCATMAMSVVACGDDDGGTTMPDASTPPPTPPTPTPPTPVPPPPPAGATVVDCTAAMPAEMIPWAISSAGLSHTIAVGAVVQWTSTDFGHTVTSGTPAAPTTAFDERIANGESVCIRFETAGTFPYFCSIHPSMTGTITVE